MTFTFKTFETNEAQIIANREEGKIYVANFKEQQGKYISVVFDEQTDPYDMEIKVSPRINLRITYLTKDQAISGVQIQKISSGKITEKISLSTLGFQEILNFLHIFSELDLKSIDNKSIVLDTSIIGDEEALRKHLKTILADEKGVRILSEIAASSHLQSKEETGVIIDDRNKTKILQQILDKDHSKEFWDLLKKNIPKLAEEFALNHLHLERSKALAEFRASLSIKGVGEEAYWQNFFEENKWIFGYGLNYQILKQEQRQPSYGGTRVDGTGEQRGDTLCSTEGDIKFTVLVEIKTPATFLLQGTSSQRNGAWSMAKQLTDGITQLQANLSTWENIGSRTDDNKDRFEDNETYTVTPKGILLIGKLDQVGTERDQRNTFERFRQGIHAVEIITFDELLKRAEFILGENS